MRWLFGLLSFCGLGSATLAGCAGDNVDPSCSSWCAVVEECTDTSLSECREACAAELRNARAISPQCVDAVKGQNACVGELTCAEFDAWNDEGPPDAYPCRNNDDEVADACVVRSADAFFGARNRGGLCAI